MTARGARTVRAGADIVTLVGRSPEVGDPAPDFACWHEAHGPVVRVALADTPRVPRLFSVVPSVDTPVCDVQTQRFSGELLRLGDRARGYTVSVDTPYALRRHSDVGCGGAGLDGLSDYRPERSFGRAWGVLVEELQELCRAVFVIDADGIVRHAQIAPDTWEHPDYDEPLAVLHALAGR